MAIVRIEAEEEASAATPTDFKVGSKGQAAARQLIAETKSNNKEIEALTNYCKEVFGDCKFIVDPKNPTSGAVQIILPAAAGKEAALPRLDVIDLVKKRMPSFDCVFVDGCAKGLSLEEMSAKIKESFKPFVALAMQQPNEQVAITQGTSDLYMPDTTLEAYLGKRIAIEGTYDKADLQKHMAFNIGFELYQRLAVVAARIVNERNVGIDLGTSEEPTLLIRQLELFSRKYGTLAGMPVFNLNQITCRLEEGGVVRYTIEKNNCLAMMALPIQLMEWKNSFLNEETIGKVIGKTIAEKNYNGVIISGGWIPGELQHQVFADKLLPVINLHAKGTTIELPEVGSRQILLPDKPPVNRKKPNLKNENSVGILS